jgi:hypothetical protein
VTDGRARGELRDDQGDAKRGLVGEQPVRGLAVIAKALAMIAGNDDESRAAARRAGCRGQERREDRVRVGNFALVGRAGILAVERRWRPVWRMRVEQVHPREPSAALRANPGTRGGDNNIAATLRQDELPAARRARVVVVVDVEPRGQAEARIDRERPHESARGEALGFQA